MAEKTTAMETNNMLSETPKAEVQGKGKENRRVPFFIVIVICFIGVACFIAGVILLVKPRCGEKVVISTLSKSENLRRRLEKRCKFSDEAERVGLPEFLERVKTTYYELHPNNIADDPDLQDDEAIDTIRDLFRPFNPEPEFIKLKTDTAADFFNELVTMNLSLDALKPRERKAYYQLEHFLRHVFGHPYDSNYYAGDFLMGPNFFCWQPICYMGQDLSHHLPYFSPITIEEVELLQQKLQQHSRVIDRYIENLKLGVRAGMVRSTEECEAGLQALKRMYFNVSRFNASGVLKEWYIQPMLSEDFLSLLQKDELDKWLQENGQTLNQTIRDYAVEFIGKPLHKLLRYLEDEYSHYCVDSSISSGLASLPLKRIYYDSKKLPNRTTRRLPDGTVLHGPMSYELILSYFTTNEVTPDQVYYLGYDHLERLYAQALEVAREITESSSNRTAEKLFRRDYLKNRAKSYYNTEPFPANESDKNAHVMCSTVKGARKYCPKRWEAMQRWFKMSRQVMSMHDPNTVGLFYFTGPKHTTPNCPVELNLELNPSSAAQSYEQSDDQCTKNAKYNIPFFLENLGPVYSEWSVNAHEARPGHHTQVQGGVEHFSDECGGLPGWLNSLTYYTAFTEGWALYAENPLIAKDTETYEGAENLMQKYGMLKWQIWRALRLVVDTGLHSLGMTRSEALQLFDQYAWDDTDLAEKEVTRYQSDPGQATAYMIGQLHIKTLREIAEEKLGEKFDIREFHFQTLTHGSSPLGYLTDHTLKYIDCTLDGTGPGCEYITGSESIPLRDYNSVSMKKKRRPRNLHPSRHYI